jgi:hypothetical protein
MANEPRPGEQMAVRTTIVGGRPPGSGKPLGPIPRGIEVLVKKASVDPAFKALLLEKRAAAADEIALKLEPTEVLMLNAVPRDQLETIIANTKVSEISRAAFLGRAATVMLAALGASALGCSEPPKPGGIAPDRIPTKGVAPDKPEQSPAPPEPTAGVRPEPAPPKSPENLAPSDGIRPDRPVTKGIQPDRPEGLTDEELLKPVTPPPRPEDKDATKPATNDQGDALKPVTPPPATNENTPPPPPPPPPDTEKPDQITRGIRPDRPVNPPDPTGIRPDKPAPKEETPPAKPEARATPEQLRRQVDALVPKLGAEDFETREAATNALIALGKDTLPLLEKLKSADAETSSRLARVMRVLRGDDMKRDEPDRRDGIVTFGVAY